MQHPEEGTIHAWLDGALDAEEAARVEQHMAECATCASAVADARGFVAGASRILAALDDVPSDVVPRSGGSLGGGGAAGQRRPRSLWTYLHLTPARAAAAAFLIVAAGTALVLRQATEVANDRAIVMAARGPAARTSQHAVVSATPILPVVPNKAADTLALGSGGGRRGEIRPEAGVSGREGPIEAQPAPAPKALVPVPSAAPARKDFEEKRAAALSQVAAVADSASTTDVVRRARARAAVMDRFDTARVARGEAQKAAVPGVAGGVVAAAAPSAARGVAFGQVRVNYAGCYSVAALGDSLSALPRLLSLDSVRFDRGASAELTRNRTSALFAVSTITDGGRRPIDTASWQPLLDGVRISFGRTPIDLRRASDSTLSVAGVAGRGLSVTMQKMDCPRR